jgi:hypothetical protein
MTATNDLPSTGAPAIAIAAAATGITAAGAGLKGLARKGARKRHLK